MFQTSTFIDPEFHFSISVPPNWYFDSSGQQGTRVILFKSAAPAGFRANVNVGLSKLGAMTAEDYLTFTRLQVKQMSGQPKMALDQPAVKPGGGHLFEWHGMMGPLHLKMRQLIVFNGPFAFVVTATALYNQFAEYRADFEAALDSFRLEESSDAPAHLP